MSKHGLTYQYLDIIKSILSHFSDKIDTVGLFGSRAQGTYRDNSDIDMVLYGDKITDDDINRLHTLFDDSNLPYKIDINAYHLIAYNPLKRHIDNVMHPLFKQHDLQMNQ